MLSGVRPASYDPRQNYHHLNCISGWKHSPTPMNIPVYEYWWLWGIFLSSFLSPQVVVGLIGCRPGHRLNFFALYMEGNNFTINMKHVLSWKKLHFGSSFSYLDDVEFNGTVVEKLKYPAMLSINCSLFLFHFIYFYFVGLFVYTITVFINCQ